MALTLPFVLISCDDDKDEPENPDTHECVDLGLPSGTLWATCNVGADNPEEFGDYFAWGETKPKEVYNWNTYKWCNASDTTMTKYCTYSNIGYNGLVDGKKELDLDDDAAYVNWGSQWRMPTKAQQEELKNMCTWKWKTLTWVSGFLVTGPNGNSLFLPAAGASWGKQILNMNTDGWYRSSELVSDGASPNASDLCFNSKGVHLADNYRYLGFSVRPVRASQN